MNEIYKTVFSATGLPCPAPCSFHGGWDIAATSKAQQSFDEDFNAFLEEHNIKMDESGNFEAYIVVDVDEEDCQVGNVICNQDTFAYSEENAYEDLKIPRISENPFFFTTASPSKQIDIEKKTSIRDDLLTMEDAIFKIVANKKDVVRIKDDYIIINKYKIIEEIVLKPILKYKIKNMYIREHAADIVLYNNITEKSKIIYLSDISGSYTDKIDSIRKSLLQFLREDENNVDIINTFRDEGLTL
ncbi:MAG: hypothetical protein WC188_09520 [Candidatus Caldatribacteriota bacterium]